MLYSVELRGHLAEGLAFLERGCKYTPRQGFAKRRNNLFAFGWGRLKTPGKQAEENQALTSDRPLR